MKVSILFLCLALISSSYCATVTLTTVGAALCAITSGDSGCTLSALVSAIGGLDGLIGGSLGSSDSLVLSSSLQVSVGITSNTNIGSITLNGASGSVLTIAAGTTTTLSNTLTVTTGTVQVAGSLVVNNAASVANGAALWVQSGASASFALGLTVNTGAAFTIDTSATATINGDSTLNGALNFTRNSAFFVQSGVVSVGQSLVAWGNTTVQSALSFTSGAYTQAQGVLYLYSSSTVSAATQPRIDADVTVNANAYLRGNGNVTGNLNIVSDASGSAGGFLQVGNSPGTVYVNGNFALSSTSTFELDIASSNSYDRVIVQGNAAINGILYAHLLNNYQPSATEQYTFITCVGTTSGDFNIVRGDINANIGKFKDQVNTHSVVASYNAGTTTVASLFLLAFAVVVAVL